MTESYAHKWIVDWKRCCVHILTQWFWGYGNGEKYLKCYNVYSTKQDNNFD